MQDQIRPVSHTPFQPAWWLKHAHLQTIFAKYLSPKHRLNTEAETISLPDGDEVQLNWLHSKTGSNNTPIIILLHGLAGDINSHYIQAMLAQCHTLGWTAVLLHFRGCNGKPNKLPRAYHSGDTADTALVITEVKRRYPNRPLVAVGYSLGGNVLLKYCGEQAGQNPLSAAVAVCPPLSLSACAKRINTGSSKLYQRYLLGRLKHSTLRKLKQFADFPLPLTPQQVKRFSSIEQFDEYYTAPIHGFLNAEDYYQKASGKAFLRHICVPTLIIHAKDDPFLSDDVIPKAGELSPHIHYELTSGGGHVGFVYGSLLKPRFWLNQRIPQFIIEQLAI
ncbi:putative alpha/beta-fold hydrolase [Rheinheimera pacifica]|uniref:hydrolase n=1 Tax=Rheinheimera pacifica TaxID=173990 RepID=UPI002167FBB6|nr:hydrolase [Rheinheimera pacifica]MCS4306446.1 putative alpha/beta-fold hydrolase [Rheinheimera pacifica]